MSDDSFRALGHVPALDISNASVHAFSPERCQRINNSDRRIAMHDARTAPGPVQGGDQGQVEVSRRLWHLYNIIRRGTWCSPPRTAGTRPRPTRSAPSGREKKRMTLGIRVEKMEFHEFDSRLRITRRHRGRAAGHRFLPHPQHGGGRGAHDGQGAMEARRSWTGCGGRWRTPRNRTSSSSPWRTTRRPSPCCGSSASRGWPTSPVPPAARCTSRRRAGRLFRRDHRQGQAGACRPACRWSSSVRGSPRRRCWP